MASRAPRHPGLPSGWLRLLAVIGLVVAALAVAGPASAHAQLLLTDPADGAQLSALPTEVTLTFSQPVLKEGRDMAVIGPNGEVADGLPVLDDRYVHEKLKPGGPQGGYVVQWRMTTVEGHVISGHFAFTYGSGPPSAAGSGDSGRQGVSPVVWMLLVVGVGVVLFGFLLASRRQLGPRRASDESPEPARHR
jgi:methionine-rich copper-binding protein CopC